MTGDILTVALDGNILRYTDPAGQGGTVTLTEVPGGWEYSLLDGFPVLVTFPDRQTAINAATDTIRELTGRYVQVTLEGAA